jgi:mono/diheme cytochrome c family protein
MTAGGTAAAAGAAPSARWLLAMLVAVHPAHAYEPQANYKLNCMGCHSEDGSGAPGKVPSVRNTLVPFAQTPAGRRYLVQVPGTSQSALSDPEIAELLNWMIRSLSGRPVPPGMEDFTAAEVTAYRSERLRDPAATRKSLLSAVPGVND